MSVTANRVVCINYSRQQRTFQITDSSKDGTRVNFIQILGVDELFNYGSVTILICFLIHKEWLLLSLENRKRNPVITSEYLKNEINSEYKSMKNVYMCRSRAHSKIIRTYIIGLLVE